MSGGRSLWPAVRAAGVGPGVAAPTPYRTSGSSDRTTPRAADCREWRAGSDLRPAGQDSARSGQDALRFFAEVFLGMRFFAVAVVLFAGMPPPGGKRVPLGIALQPSYIPKPQPVGLTVGA